MGRKTDGHYLNLQFVCDSNLRFLDAVIKYPGSVTDKTIWSIIDVRTKGEVREFSRITRK